MVRRDAVIYDQLSMFVIQDLRSGFSEFPEDKLSFTLLFGVGLLRTVSGHFECCFVAFSPRGQKNDRRKQVVATQARDQFLRCDLPGSLIH